MKQFEIIYLAPGLAGSTLIERGVLSSTWQSPELLARELQLSGGFKNELTGKFVAWPAVLEIDAIN